MFRNSPTRHGCRRSHAARPARAVRGARDLDRSVQYGNAFGQGLQAAALKPADFFGNEDVLYLMEDMATGEIRLSILWEWLHKGAKLTAADAETGVKEGDTFSRDLCMRLLREEYDKLLKAGNRDVHDDSKTDDAAHRARDRRDLSARVKPSCRGTIDFCQHTLGNHDLSEAQTPHQKLGTHFAPTYAKLRKTRLLNPAGFAQQVTWCLAPP